MGIEAPSNPGKAAPSVGVSSSNFGFLPSSESFSLIAFTYSAFFQKGSLYIFSSVFRVFSLNTGTLRLTKGTLMPNSLAYSLRNGRLADDKPVCSFSASSLARLASPLTGFVFSNNVSFLGGL